MTLTIWDVEREERENIRLTGGVAIDYLDTTVKVFKTSDNDYYHFKMHKDESQSEYGRVYNLLRV